MADVATKRRRTWRERFRRALRGSLVALGILVPILVLLTWISTDHFRSFGGPPSEVTMARILATGRYRDGKFQNLERTGLMAPGSSWEVTKQWLFPREMRVPICPLPRYQGTHERLATPPLSGLRATWLGHSTTLLEIDGTTILTDPMWSERASPSTWVGPKRFHPPPVPLSELPHVDAVVISHDHFDHLDMETVRALGARGVPFHVALGVGGHLAAWGVPAAQIIEHDWWETTTLASGLQIVSTPARHFSGRGVPWRAGTLWTSWSLVGPKHRVFVSGDTGQTDSFSEIGAREGPFDVALIEIGQYHPSWGDIHLGPIGALDAFGRVNAKALLPIHWATFELALHAWSEPAETLSREAAARYL
jgi:L-ascorbate metabolism protein UlaG (beta-lactamase superfamily)